MGGEELKWRQLTHNQLMSPQGPHFSPHSTVKTNDKSTNLRKNGISDVVTASVYSEKTRLKKLMMKMIIIRKKRRIFTGARKVMVDFKFDALYRQVFIESS